MRRKQRVERERLNKLPSSFSLKEVTNDIYAFSLAVSISVLIAICVVFFINKQLLLKSGETFTKIEQLYFIVFIFGIIGMTQLLFPIALKLFKRDLPKEAS